MSIQNFYRTDENNPILATGHILKFIRITLSKPKISVMSILNGKTVSQRMQRALYVWKVKSNLDNLKKLSKYRQISIKLKRD